MPFTYLLRKIYISVKRENPKLGLAHEIKMQFGLNFALKESGNRSLYSQ